MNERLFRTQFNQMETTEKQALMESLATRYDMTFLGLHTFDRWGQSCTTGIFKKDGREFVFVPGDTVTLGWEQFAVGLNQESREELDYLFQEWEMERGPGGDDPGKHGSRSAGSHWPYAGGPGAGGTMLGAGQNGRSQADCAS